jgi:hypothetical protein
MEDEWKACKVEKRTFTEKQGSLGSVGLLLRVLLLIAESAQEDLFEAEDFFVGSADGERGFGLAPLPLNNPTLLALFEPITKLS